jgi:CubicO group peptidase (beta-lactamase class C family)
MVPVDGTCDDRFSPVREVMVSNLEAGHDVGCSVAVVLDGELVVDLWGGHLDEARTTPWQRDTIVTVFSATKVMTNLCALLLADRGEIGLDQPVARYWPEFAAAGKERVEVRHVLGHTAGLPGFTEPVSVDDMYDWERMTSLLAAQEPWWEPGTKLGYHALTQGYLVGEVVRRVTGRTLGRFFADEVAGPLGADFHIGVPPDVDPRVALVVPPPVPVADLHEPGSLGHQTIVNPPFTPEETWTERWRRAEIPAGNGHGNARSMAVAQAAVSCGAGGLLSDAGVDAIFEVQAEGPDAVSGQPMRMGIGYAITSELLMVSPNPKTCFWAGAGGCVVINDVEARMTIAYTPNRMLSENEFGRAAAVVLASYQSLFAGG